MESFGSRTKREREQRGITLQDISKSTKIRIHYLLAIEQEHLDELPGGMICRGFVRAYARHIGFDDEQAVEALLGAYNLSQIQLVPITKPEPFVKRCRDHLMQLPLWILAPGFVVLGLGLVNLGHELGQRYNSLRESTMMQVVSSNSAPPALHRDEARGMQSSEISASKELGSQHFADQFAPKRQEGFSSLSAAPTSSKSDKFTIAIKVRKDAWVSIMADGHPVLSATLVAPAEKVVEAHECIVIRAGNIGAVDFSFNGTRLPTQGAYDEARTLNFDVNGLQTRLANSLAAPVTDVPTVVEQ